MTPEQAIKEMIGLVEQWAHEYSANETFLEYVVTKKIESFCNSGPKTVKYFGSLLTHLLFRDEGPEIEIMRKIYGQTASRRLIKYVWSTRYNLLSFLNKKEFIYKPLTKLYVTLEQAINLSPKFFSKKPAEIMEVFLPELNVEAVTIRNKVMVSVSRWYHLLIRTFIRCNKGSLTPFIPKRKVAQGKNAFIAKCFRTLDSVAQERSQVDLLLQTKNEEDKYQPRNNYRGEYHAHDDHYEVRNILSKGKTNKNYQPGGNMMDERDDLTKKSF